jgi:O-acetyl-ADP-ribose deacetylase (regulator of RNase III)
MSTNTPITTSINGRSLELVLGDITQQEVDAIVNAANSRLAGGGGVDGAIHRAGGPTIMAETRRRYPHGCPTGSAVITSAGNLKAQYVIHAVGPFWSGGGHRPKGGRGEERLLASAYQAALGLAVEHDCRSVALPALSTGAYRYPVDEAGRVAVSTAAQFLGELDESQPLEIVRFVLFSEEVLQAFERGLRRMGIAPRASK